MICERNYKTYGPYKIKPWGNDESTGRWRVHDAAGRRITEVIPKKEAQRQCRLLNDVFFNALQLRIVVAFESGDAGGSTRAKISSPQS